MPAAAEIQQTQQWRLLQVAVAKQQHETNTHSAG